MTLRDVSEAAGVSEMTVSRVLRGRGEVSERTRARVLEAARRLGYVPNRIAGSLASSRVNLVAVVVPSLSNLVFPELLAGVSEVLDGTPLQPVVGTTGYDQAREEEVLFDMLSWRPSGVIVAGLEHSDAARAMLAGAGVPVVEVADVDGDPVDACVGISHWRAGYRIGTEIARRGYRAVGLLGSKHEGDHRARKRTEGVERALAEAGVPVAARAEYKGSSGMAVGRRMTAEAMGEAKLDFLWYNNDLTAAGGLLWCLEHGYDVGGDLGLAGFNNFDLLGGLPKRLATVDSARRETGRQAARIVIGETGFAEGDDRRIELVSTFLPGETMRPAG
nr:LacI family DNA-binding transcriptional regulator [Jannaschia sp. Os4]